MGRGVPVRGASVRAPPAGDNLDALRDRWGLAFPFVVPLSEHRPRGDDLDALRDRWGVAFPFVVLPSEYRPRGDNLNASVRAWGRECTEGLHDGMRQGNTLRGSGASPARLQMWQSSTFRVPGAVCGVRVAKHGHVPSAGTTRSGHEYVA